jgi:hypothetical protein
VTKALKRGKEVEGVEKVLERERESEREEGVNENAIMIYMEVLLAKVDTLFTVADIFN